MAKRSFHQWLALASAPLVLATACQGSSPPTSGSPPGKPSDAVPAATSSLALPDPGAAKTYEVQAKAFKMPKRIWVRGKRHPIPPPAPLRLKRKLMAVTGYPVTTVAQGSLFSVPCDLDFDGAKNAYVANLDFDTGLGGIVKLTPDNQASFFSSQPGISMDADVTGTKLAAAAIRFIEDTPGLINNLATFQLPSAVPNLVIDALSNYQASLPPGPVPLSMATWSTLWDAAYDNAGNLLVVDADEKYNAIRRIDRTTNQVDVVASLGATSLSVAPSGVIYCTVGNAIWSVTPGGETHLLAGTGEEGFSDGPGATASFRLPNKVVYGDDGYLYVADSGNCAIRRVSLQGEVATIAGNGTAGNADGNGTDATFNFPIGLRYGPDGNLYVADSFNNSVRRIELPKGVEFFVSDPTKPDDRSGAFSPNGDGVKDDVAITVKAGSTTDWTLTIDGYGAIPTGGTPNRGNKSLTWDGKMKGVTLPDGNYTIRLKYGVEERVIAVTVDTISPKIISEELQSINSDILQGTQLIVKNSYTLKVKANDNTAGAGLADDAITYESANLAKKPNTVRVNAGEFDAIAEVTSGLASKLDYTLVVTDKAGNRASLPGDIRGETVTPGKPILSQSEPQNPQAYQLLAKVTNGGTSFQGVYYAQSGLKFSITQKYTFKYYVRGIPVKGKPGEVHMAFRKASPGIAPGFLDNGGKLTFRTWNQTPEVTFSWDGRNAMGAPVPDGEYILEPLESGWIVDPQPFHLKVSGRPCIKLQDWLQAPVGDMVYQRAYHIINRHILVGPGGNIENRHFGDYTSLFLAYRPPGFPNSNKEINTGHPFTKAYMNTYIYKSVLRIASKVWGVPRQPGDSPQWVTAAFSADPNNPSSYAPVVFPAVPGASSRVVWVYVSKPFLGQTLYEQWYKNDPRYPNELFHNVFPFYKAQLDYEANIR